VLDVSHLESRYVSPSINSCDSISSVSRRHVSMSSIKNGADQGYETKENSAWSKLRQQLLLLRHQRQLRHMPKRKLRFMLKLRRVLSQILRDPVADTDEQIRSVC
jgi:hypothetical protein